MKGLKFKQEIIEVTLTAEEWSLYTYNMDCDKAAKELNRVFKKAVNAGFTRSEVNKVMGDTQNKYADYGAYDSEPNAVLSHLLEAVFGEE